MAEFVNPYNFIALRYICSREPYEPGKLTGYISCRLTATTPLFIPNTSSDNAFQMRPMFEDHKNYDFYSYREIGENENTTNTPPKTPVIPGSELRGVIRSCYEALTYSCMSTVEDRPLTARSNDVKKPGILQYDNGAWQLFSAKHYRLKTSRTEGENGTAGTHRISEDGRGSYIEISGTRYYSGDKIRFTPAGCQTPTAESAGGRNESDCGILLLGESFPGKGNDHIMVMQGGPLPAKNLEHAVENLRAVLDYYRDDRVNKSKGHTGYKGYEIRKDRPNPIFFNNVGSGIYYLSPACIGRDVFYRRLNELLTQSGGYQPCSSGKGDDKPSLCPACRLFGMVSQTGGGAVGSRVRFSDALPSAPENVHFMNTVTLGILANPKISTAEFYTVKPQYRSTKYWNYDYCYADSNTGYGKTPAKTVLEPNELKLRGRKFYWHAHGDVLKKGIKPDRFNTTVRPLGAGSSFLFRVYFERVTEQELRRLVWILCLGDNTPQSTLQHKIGHGKPLGLGSAKITVEAVKLRRLLAEKNAVRYVLEDYPVEQCMDKTVFPDKKAVEELLVIADAKSTEDKTVSYPYALNKKGENVGYEWFVKNRTALNNKIPQFRSPLPHITDKDITQNTDPEVSSPGYKVGNRYR